MGPGKSLLGVEAQSMLWRPGEDIEFTSLTFKSEWPEPKQVQHWPGKLGHELRNKVNTSVSYDIHTGNRISWGFLCNPDDERYEYNALFKLYLDPEYKDAIEDAPSTAEAQTWYRDYLACLYQYISKWFDSTDPRFMQKRVE